MTRSSRVINDEVIGRITTDTNRIVSEYEALPTTWSLDDDEVQLNPSGTSLERQKGPEKITMMAQMEPTGPQEVAQTALLDDTANFRVIAGLTSIATEDGGSPRTGHRPPRR